MPPLPIAAKISYVPSCVPGVSGIDEFYCMSTMPFRYYDPLFALEDAR